MPEIDLEKDLVFVSSVVVFREIYLGGSGSVRHVLYGAPVGRGRPPPRGGDTPSPIPAQVLDPLH